MLRCLLARWTTTPTCTPSTILRRLGHPHGSTTPLTRCICRDYDMRALPPTYFPDPHHFVVISY